MSKAPHIHLEKSESYARVVVCGSPERAKKMAAKLQDMKPVAANREYHSYLGKHEGAEILVISHGVGSAGAAICFQELIDCGAKALVRIGTAGALQDDLEIGDVVLASSAVRKDGVSRLMVPIEYPAMADFDLTLSLRENLRKKGWKGKAGTVLTTDLFYPGKLDDELKLYQSVGASAVEMEIATLFIVSQLRGVRASAMVVLDGNPLKWKDGNYDPRPERLAQSVDLCFSAAIDELARIKL
jgi:uridine phosphorylase